jgi:hypothetical protein
MRPALQIMESLLIIGLFFRTMIRYEGQSQSNDQSSAITESQARKLLSESPWAKRAKIRSTAKAPTYSPTIENPGTTPGGLGPGGPGHGNVPPTAAEIANRVSGPQGVPCLGWGIGSMAVASPTSEECKAAWQTVSVAKSAGLPKGFVVVLWDSAVPVREAKTRLSIADPDSVRANDTIIISVIAHPLLSQINPNSAQMKQMIKQSAVLLLSGKHEIQASDVAFIEGDESVIRFLFPRQQMIQANDKEFVFRFETSDSLVEAKFSPKEMVYGGSRHCSLQPRYSAPREVAESEEFLFG